MLTNSAVLTISWSLTPSKLSGEQTRWVETKKTLRDQLKALPQQMLLAAAFHLPPPRPRVSTLVAAEPPALDDRQAAFMRQAGYQWDEERNKWYRGDLSRRVRAEVRENIRELCASGAFGGHVGDWDSMIPDRQEELMTLATTVHLLDCWHHLRNFVAGHMSSEMSRHVADALKEKLWRPSRRGSG